MKKLLLILICLIYSSNCFGKNKWEFLVSGEESTLFFDTSNITPYLKYENSFNVDVLENYEIQSVQSNSSVYNYGINCNEHKFQIVHSILYSEKMGKGKVIDKGYIEGELKGKWFTPIQGSMSDVLVSVVCKYFR